jgi:hypothetical protein
VAACAGDQGGRGLDIDKRRDLRFSDRHEAGGNQVGGW